MWFACPSRDKSEKINLAERLPTFVIRVASTSPPISLSSNKITCTMKKCVASRVETLPD